MFKVVLPESMNRIKLNDPDQPTPELSKDIVFFFFLNKRINNRKNNRLSLSHRGNFQFKFEFSI